MIIRILQEEWYLWSKCFGKVVILNGVSCVGKSTLGDYISRFGYTKISVDDLLNEFLFNYTINAVSQFVFAKEFLSNSDLWKIIYGFQINKNKYKIEQVKIIKHLENTVPSIINEGLDLFIKTKGETLWNKVQEFICSGKNVIIDTVITTNQEIEFYSYCLKYYPTQIILLYSSLDKNLENCNLRNTYSLQNDLCNYRSPAQLIEQYFLFYTFTSNYSINDSTTLNNPLIFLDTIVSTKVMNVIEEQKPHAKVILNEIYGIESNNYLNEILILEKLITDSSKLLNKSLYFSILPSIKFDYLIKSESIKILDGEYTSEAMETISVLLGDIELG